MVFSCFDKNIFASAIVGYVLMPPGVSQDHPSIYAFFGLFPSDFISHPRSSVSSKNYPVGALLQKMAPVASFKKNLGNKKAPKGLVSLIYARPVNALGGGAMRLQVLTLTYTLNHQIAAEVSDTGFV